MKIIDLFCGCGGLSFGFEEAGFEIALAIDKWEDAIQTYNHNHKRKVSVSKDIHELSNEFLKDISNKNQIVGIIGGPPCQGYSTVGTRDIEDPRNHLYLEYCRVVEQVKPEFFVIENVKGLVTLNNGLFKNDIILRFESMGYNVSFEVINAADFGVPQNRHRVFFVGMKNKKFVFPKESLEIISSEDAISDLPIPHPAIATENMLEYNCVPKNSYQKNMRFNSTGVYNHQITNHSEQTINIISMIKDGGKISDLPKEYWNIRKYNKAFQRMNSQLPSNTIDTGHRNYFHYSENRIPTVRESARIQSFRDDFIFLGSRTSQYKQVGNAVPPILAKKIAEAIMSQLNYKEVLDYASNSISGLF
jgi:DNA (cytosine-5)-methyltransferase 1